MLFLTTQHKQRCLAALATKTANDAATKNIVENINNEFKSAAAVGALARSDRTVILAALRQDLGALKELVDVAKKIELKKTHLIPKWKSIVDKYIENGERGYFEPFVRLVIWLLDAEQLAEAIKYADIAIAQQQPMPEDFKRDLATFAAETVHDWAAIQLSKDHSADPYFTDVVARVESNQWLVIEPIALNRIYKLAGIFAEKANDYKLAEKYYLKCVDANPEKHGVKGRLKAVQEKLSKS